MNNNDLQARKQPHIKNYDYTQDNVYHVTICTMNKQKILSAINNNNQIILSKTGPKANGVIQQFAEKYPYIKILEYCIMPNHIHLLMQYKSSENVENPVNLSSFVSQLKGNVSKTVKMKIWQNGYYGHIIRGEEDYLLTLQYIRENPIKWQADKYYK